MSKSEALKEKKRGSLTSSLAENKVFFISGFTVFCLWLVFCWQGLSTVVEIWYGNEIFNHGFFIVPGSLYLIYLKRHALLAQRIYTTPLAFIIIIPSILLYIVGVAGDVQLFMHTATFTLLPSLIWLMIGTKAAKTILFPLVFMLFSIPVGEQLIPYLQEIAADGSVALLQLTGVPLFRSGLYIEIPQGRFLVAEACSGVSFFIASFVIGSLYAYLNLTSVKRRATFVAISLIFPVLANIVRVYGIILIAYWTDMEHAAGADHLIYGWFFFAFVIICLLGIGELIRRPVDECSALVLKEIKLYVNARVLLSLVIMLLSGTLWLSAITNTAKNRATIQNLSLASIEDKTCKRGNWKPNFVNPSSQQQVYVAGSNCKEQVYEAWFNEVDNELVSNLHRVFDQNMYSLSHTQQIHINNISLTVYHVVSPSGEKISIVRWYEVDKKLFGNALSTKLYQLKNIMLNNGNGGRMWVFAIKVDNEDHIEDALFDILSRLENV